MLENSENGRHLINEFAYHLVITNAPEELPLFVDLRDRYFAEPEQYLRPDDSRDEALAFGDAEVIKTFTYHVFPLITPILAYMVNEVKQVIKEEVSERAIQIVRNWFKEEKASPQPIFTQAQLAVIAREIDQIVEKETRRLCVNKSQATAIRNAIMAKLALVQI